MSPWRDIRRISLEHARRQNIAVLHFGASYPVSVGKQMFTLQFEPCRASYPLRLHGQAGGATLTLDCDAQALFPELARQSLTQAGASAHLLITQAFEDWLDALEGVFGFTLDVSGTSFDVASQPGAYGLVLTHERSHRAAHFALDSEAIDQWLERQPAPVDDMARLSHRLRVPVPVCKAGPALTLPRLRAIRRGDALLLNRASLYLRMPLSHGARRILLKPSGEYMLIDVPMIDENTESAEMTSELVPANALTFPFDAVIGTLSLTFDELTRLRTGSIVSLQLPVHRNSVLLLCQGVPFARGELIDIDDALGVRIVDLTHMAETRSSS
ncbi:FliM/FliN family flagellar motor switch protein [Paraburkholderia adhaesiva]|uniref:FliM/FliN family flagellar motor switch protein n=1 Tax=Paraburkholderia adhaesiva TaxID=2883244 RepID=UPI001F46C6BC|nr:FliM/FliN family flagellar motor switch protein [Paraburkholderia adhaesiva]